VVVYIRMHLSSFTRISQQARRFWRGFVKFRLVLLGLVVLSPYAWGQEGPLLSWLPQEKIMPVFAANATAHRISLTRLLKDNQYVGSMGGFFPIVSATLGGHETQFGIGGTVYTQFYQARTHLEVVNVDFYVDFLLDYRLDDERILRVGAGHTSQHLVDDAFEILGYQKSINYVRDYAQAYLAQDMRVINGFLYGGFHYIWTFRVPEPGNYHWLFEVGGEGLNEEIMENVFVYLAADIKFRQELGFATSQSYQAGIRLKGSTRSLRLAYGYRTGLEERGQFYQQRIYWNTLGLFFEF